MIVRIRSQWRRRFAVRAIRRWGRLVFLAGGCLQLAICAFAYIQAALYQALERARLESAVMLMEPALIPSRAAPPALRANPAMGSAFSRLDIPRAGISVMVVEGATARSLRLGVGHIPGTAFPGESGNTVIAGHRDTFFRPLRRVGKGDTVILTTLYGAFQYSVDGVSIVAPTDRAAVQSSKEPVLTLITCYPFYYVGAAPKRFIVRARMQVPEFSQANLRGPGR
jgi:sortase A